MNTILLVDVVTGGLGVEFGPEISVSKATPDLRFVPVTPPVTLPPRFNSGVYRFAPIAQAAREQVRPAAWEEGAKHDALTALVVTTVLANFFAAMLLHWL